MRILPQTIVLALAGVANANVHRDRVGAIQQLKSKIEKDDAATTTTSPIDTVAASGESSTSQANQGAEVLYENTIDTCYNTPLLPDQLKLAASPCYHITLPWPLSRQIQFTREGAFKSG